MNSVSRLLRTLGIGGATPKDDRDQLHVDRALEYHHRDVAGGIRTRLSPQFRIGAMLGYLLGDPMHKLGQDDSSYRSTTLNSGPSHFCRPGDTGQPWVQDGRTNCFGVDVTEKPKRATTLTLLYRHEQSAVNIASGSAIMDTSYSRYSWMDNTGTVTNYSRSYMNDTRFGVGTRDLRTERIPGSLQRTITDQVRLSIGVIVDWRNIETKTPEAAQLASRSAYWSTSGSGITGTAMTGRRTSTGIWGSGGAAMSRWCALPTVKRRVPVLRSGRRISLSAI